MARPTSTPMPQAYRAPFEATSSSDAILMNSDFRGWLICIPRIHRTAAAHRRLVPTPPLLARSTALVASAGPPRPARKANCANCTNRHGCGGQLQPFPDLGVGAIGHTGVRNRRGGGSGTDKDAPQ